LLVLVSFCNKTLRQPRGPVLPCGGGGRFVSIWDQGIPNVTDASRCVAVGDSFVGAKWTALERSETVTFEFIDSKGVGSSNITRIQVSLTCEYENENNDRPNVNVADLNKIFLREGKLKLKMLNSNRGEGREENVLIVDLVVGGLYCKSLLPPTPAGDKVVEHQQVIFKTPPREQVLLLTLINGWLFMAVLSSFCLMCYWGKVYCRLKAVFRGNLPSNFGEKEMYEIVDVGGVALAKVHGA